MGPIQTRKLLTGILLVLFVGSAAATSIDDLNRQDFWLNDDGLDTLEAQVSCSDSSNNINSIRIMDGSQEQNSESYDSSSSSYSHIFSAPGTYTLEATCENEDTASRQVKVRRLVLENPKSKVSGYRGSNLGEQNSSRQLVIGLEGPDYEGLDESHYTVRLSNYGDSLPGTGPVPTSDDGRAVVRPFIPESTPGGLHLMEVFYELEKGPAIEVDYRGSQDGVQFTVKDAWNIDVNSVTPAGEEIPYQKLNELEMELDVEYRGRKRTDLGSKNYVLNVYRDGEIYNGYANREWFDVTQDPGSPGTYTLDLKQVPQMEIGRYRFELVIESDDGDVKVGDLDVVRYILFSGRILDAKGAGVDSSISMTDNTGLTRNFQTGSQGKYSENILPGKYDFRVDFPEARLELSNVSLEKGSQASIAYDSPAVNKVDTSTLDGVTAVNLVGVTFGYPFEEGIMRMQYDPSQINFEQLKVFECKNWNLQGRTCYTEWKPLDDSRVSVFPTAGEARFPVSPIESKVGNKTKSILLNAYVIGSNTPLLLDSLDVSRQQVPVGQDLTVTGEIETPQGSSVSGVRTTVSLVADGDVLSNATGITSNGDFEIPVTAPEETGTYQVRVKAERAPYDGFETTTDVSVESFIQRSISVEMESDTMNLYPGETSQTQFTVTNTGQAPIENAKIAVRGLNKSVYSFDRSTWSEIEAGESKTVTLTAELPSGYCGEQCQQYPTLRVEATGVSGEQDVNQIITVQSVVKKEKTATRQSETADPSDSSGSLAAPDIGSDVINATGNFLATQSSFNIALGLMTLFMFVLAAAVKKKKKSGSGDRRTGRQRGGGGGSRLTSQPPVVSEGGDSSTESAPEADASEPEDQASGENNGAESHEQEKEHHHEQDEGGNFECSKCGEEFDTDSARKLHEQAMH